MPRARPSGTVTFLGTDIEDSTRRWDEDPTAMANALRAHDAIVRGAIERHGGYVFGAGGDGFRAAFPAAADAVAAAVEAQTGLRDDTTVDFAVRTGIHTGEATERDRTYIGSEVNRAARLTAIAHGGQVLVSDATEVLVRDRVALRALGEHRLPGVRGRIAVHQVLADGLRADFPVLRRVAAVSGNLPLPLDSVVGREQLVAEVAELVRDHRLVTLTGVGGVGKTRLAVEVGVEVAAEFPDGVWLVELARVTDPAAVPAAVAATLGVTPRADASLVDTLADALAARQLLLVLDNCEHVLAAAAATVTAVLGRADHARIVATSREALAIPGEQPRSVPPLDAAGGVTSDAVTLFVDRARSARADFGIHDTETAGAVTEICDTVDGLPLGIELAAARMAAMGAVEVRDRRADRFRLLQRTAPGPERQLTLRHAVEWSYDLLNDDERALLTRAAVFAGGFDLAALVAVAAADEIDVLRDLDSLVRKSLVVADHSGARTRYSLFETIRQFAEDQLEREGGIDAARDRHAAHFARGPWPAGTGGTARAGAARSTGWRRS
jgi:predicted ATPase/class 3 adenylate cyclase